jgi:hypothetical protein
LHCYGTLIQPSLLQQFKTRLFSSLGYTAFTFSIISHYHPIKKQRACHRGKIPVLQFLCVLFK